MKQLTCEMCGSTEMLKQDGVFVCQTCGTKYTVEEAKKMMVEGTVEVQGNVQVQNAAQLDNLLKLAHSSFESKNYAQAEEFCNQVIAMDDQNYDAWKLKGEAINYQINSNNQRILEVYNCIMTSYRILDEEQKEEKKHEILSSLKDCFEGEVDFWLKQFEANRPSDSTLTRAKNAYVDSYNKMAAAFDELKLNESKQGYLTNFDNFFIKKANSICVSAWKSTVAYNYYRDDLDNLGSGWGLGNGWSNLVTTNTDSYRPTKQIWQTFIEEGGKLIALLQFAEEQFNDETPYQSKENVYENIIYFHEKLSKAVWYKIGTSVNDVGWLHDGSLTDEAKRLRQNIINQYKQKITDAKNEDVRKKTEKVLEESEDSDVDLIIAEVIIDITEGNYIEAEARFDIIIKKAPASPIGYVGKALAIVAQDNGEKNALSELRKAFQYTPADEDEKDNLEFFINYEYGENDTTLLMVAAANYDYDAVKYLVDSGADIDAASSYNVTALWYVCRKKPDEANVEAARKIAKLLLDNGAEIDVKNKGGIALYNKETDYEIARMIKEKFPDAEQGAAPAKSGGGCYVATAVYGSYDCPEVWTLRRYRDYTLAETWQGRAFIKTYYAISPTLVKWFGHTEWFKKMWQGKLDRMVAKLQADGVESTPYEDKNW